MEDQLFSVNCNAARKVTTVEANFHIYLGFGRNGKDIREEKKNEKNVNLHAFTNYRLIPFRNRYDCNAAYLMK